MGTFQTKMNIDQLHEATLSRNKLEQEQFEKSVMKLLKRRSYI